MGDKSPELIEMMRQLIGTPSISCVQSDLDMSNEPVIDLLANWLDDCGFCVNKQNVGVGKYNLIATLGDGSDGLILSGHTDTVPMDEKLWQSDPFKLTERDDRLYGLGSCDMKSFLALAIAASQGFDPASFKHPLTIVATADEETTMSGARMLAQNGERLGRYCVIGEPTALKPIREHKGIMMESVHFTGSSGHSSDPALGNSALEGMHEFIQRLLNFRNELQRRHINPAFKVDVPTLNLGHIHGGDNPNRICGECELHFDLRFLPGMDLLALRAEIHEIAQKVAQQRGLQVDFEALFPGIPAMATAADSELTRYLEQATRCAAGSVAFGTEGPYFNALDCETIILGPGSINQAHQPDEFLPMNQIAPTLQLLQGLIKRFCLQ